VSIFGKEILIPYIVYSIELQHNGMPNIKLILLSWLTPHGDEIILDHGQDQLLITYSAFISSLRKKLVRNSLRIQRKPKIC
jgi:hypothetical protein